MTNRFFTHDDYVFWSHAWFKILGAVFIDKFVDISNYLWFLSYDGHVFIFQACICANRVLVQDSIYDIFVDTLAKTMEKELRIGDGFDPKSTQGPLINHRAVEKVH